MWQLPSKLTGKREAGNQATTVQCLQRIVWGRHSLWEKGGAPNPKGVSKLRLKDRLRVSRCREEGWPPTGRGHCMNIDRRNRSGTGQETKHKTRSVLLDC